MKTVALLMLPMLPVIPLLCAFAVVAPCAESASDGAGPDGGFSSDVAVSRVSAEPAPVPPPASSPRGTERTGEIAPKPFSGDAGEPCPITGDADAGAAGAVPFSAWLRDFKEQAKLCGISPETIRLAFRGVRPSEEIRRLDGSQAEYTKTFFGYLSARVTDGLVRIGRARIRQHRMLLSDLENEYGVEAESLVALWGLESGFGADIGKTPVITALATLAYDGRRSAFYRGELLSALRILEEGHTDPGRMLGSWAGAMGQTQLMPSTFLSHAVDADGDGRIDVWDSVPDALASAAKYLRNIHWTSGQPWGREVSLPPGFDAYQARLDFREPNGFWSGQGVLRADGRPLPATDLRGAILLPAGALGPAFLVYGNFDVITEWNRSLFYALSVGHLSNRLAGNGRLVAKAPPGDGQLRAEAVRAMQRDLNALGYPAGEPDGMVGKQTRRALRDYQRDRGLTADAYPTPRLMARLRAEGRGDASAPATGDPSPAEILRLQRNLRRLGYQVGELDGKMGPRTRRALGAYLRDRGHPAVEEPTPEILQRLTREARATEDPAAKGAAE